MTLEEFVPSKAKVEVFTNTYFKRINSIFYYGLLGFYFLGIAIGFYYENLIFAVLMGAVTLASFYISKAVFSPYSTINKHIASIAMAMFYLQYTIQAYGAFYIYFVFFLSITSLILYQDWKVLFSFYIMGMLINSGKIILDFLGLLDNDSAFYSQAVYKEITTEELIIAFSFAFIQFLICLLFANYLRRQTLKNAKNTIYLEEQLNLEANTQLAYDITHGDLETPYQLNENDAMGKALINMRENLKSIREKEKTSQMLNEATSEIAKILLKSDNIQELAKQVLQSIAKYINAQQAAFYVLNDMQLELAGTYGCHSELKDKNSIFQIGEGLIGEVAQQQETVVIDNPPESYVRIGSGLGEAIPRCVIVVPLKFQQNLQGVMEIAAFKSINAFEKAFLESVSEKIATSLNSVKSKLETNKLLQDAQVLNEQLKSQEEETKMNMEMMAHTQSEIARINGEMEGTLAAINLSFISVEMDEQGCIKNLNRNFEEKTGCKFSTLKDKEFDALLASNQDIAFWKDVLAAQNLNKDFAIKSLQGQELWIRGIFTTIKVKKNDPGKILFFGYDITEQKLANIKLKENYAQSSRQAQQLKNQEVETQANMVKLQLVAKEAADKSNELEQLLKQKEEEIKALKKLQKINGQ